ncbi:MAG: hypothetical protein JSU94_03415 [Phycisphaerales bacterium]|nr:MAG: hypothetical protein JSU94_03415 [Phycisphaerales bacterium]
MPLLVGIDEAGFGPILGPLVVSSTTFSLSRQLLNADLWQILKRSVGPRRKHLAGRLLVTDSKKAYSKSLGIGHLQRTVLAFLRCIERNPATLGEVVAMLSPDLLERLAEYPWYADACGFPLSADEADEKIASQVLADDLASNGIELLDLKSRCLDVACYNRMVEGVRNKANVLFTATAGLINEAFDAADSDTLHVVADRQGGRVRYRKVLRVMFPDTELTILRENPTGSSYELRAGRRVMRLHFVVGADRRFLPVSLASMLSKYLRELLVGSLNRYFAGFGVDIRPTAGYWKDGLRFLDDLRTCLPHLQVDRTRLIRCR